MEYKIELTPKAVNDLRQIRDYSISELYDSKAGLKLVQSIINSYKQLTTFPKMGKKLSKQIPFKTNYFYLVSQKYLIFYQIKKESIIIYRIIHSQQDYLEILFSDDEITF
ncbi:type II toxin-antitoxin system RelE/ParE family toxin [Enterococcus faecalis]|uniref:type II toxin-antitoxin system RelE/ParE family toxin n=1 Tax=Enterococcus faecalis TaxID=1351 RepID=UPI0012E1992D|nr:type II toxin-antitoxin system RelE/ParE family toxin [Enterococcus faecalis]EGO6562259.1 type II toxin-antitoxin system RelE/ParE family toxin [Enterococcus faecalis]EGO7560216.1 type II toxin-antitoxin system RelE/ParE family toxin [Enterococcus faecalis]EGO7742214.1 type II toxin-antitoxin system RelE/ParE family toxin [Enterococcus faecalis]EIP7780829.1 type II toxin-antitoxin system RelE/ParE family toxin [Enterococcus faecalis]